MFKVCVVIALAALALADPWDGYPLAEKFIHLGEAAPNAQNVDCDAYSKLFEDDGVLHSPGIPDAFGRDSIAAACQESHKSVSPLLSFQHRNIAVQSWNMEKRLAFSWTINGVRTKDSTNVAAPAITAIFADAQQNINVAYSFYDDALITGNTPVPPPFDPTKVVNAYVSMGSRTKELRNCTAWANLFTPDGVSNEPGIPPNNGTDGLIKACQIKGDRFSVLIPAVETMLPVMSWNTQKRVAFTWTLTGVSHDTTYIVPAITVLLMDSNQKIQQAWDWWNTDLLPPTVL